MDCYDIERFALERNRDHSVVSEIASRDCISDSLSERKDTDANVKLAPSTGSSLNTSIALEQSLVSKTNFFTEPIAVRSSL